MPSIFVLGATGYIGGAVLFALLQEISGLEATALVRSDKHANVFSKHGISCVQGSNEDISLITELASKADIVLNAADADAEPMVKAILKGCKRHLEETGTKSLFVHTSGTAILGDGAEGRFNPLTPVYDDRNVELLKSIPAKAIHRNVEQKVVDADEAGYVSAYIISPSTIYGESSSPIPRASLLTNLILKMSSAIKGVPTLDDGGNLFNLIHIKDVASLYVAVIKYGLSGNDQEVGWGRYFFAAGYEYTWFSVAKAYAVALHTKSLVDTGDPVAISVTKVPVMRFFGGNSRAFPGRATELGWRVTQPPIFATVNNDVEIGLK